jgi:hypothetical protein
VRTSITILALLSLSSECFADIVTNGGFEKGDFTGWTVSADPVNTFVDMELPHTGLFSAALGEFPTDGHLSQILPTTPGGEYTLTYWLQNDGGTPNDFSASWNGSRLPGSVLSNADGFDYTQYVFTDLVATSPSTLLGFAFEQTPAYWHLDDVAVNPVPEPSSAPILLSIFVGSACGRMIRRSDIRVLSKRAVERFLRISPSPSNVHRGAARGVGGLELT